MNCYVCAPCYVSECDDMHVIKMRSIEGSIGGLVEDRKFDIMEEWADMKGDLRRIGWK